MTKSRNQLHIRRLLDFWSTLNGHTVPMILNVISKCYKCVNLEGYSNNKDWKKLFGGLGVHFCSHMVHII